jgi:hypothetical protein
MERRSWYVGMQGGRRNLLTDLIRACWGVVEWIMSLLSTYLENWGQKKTAVLEPRTKLLRFHMLGPVPHL